MGLFDCGNICHVWPSLAVKAALLKWTKLKVEDVNVDIESGAKVEMFPLTFEQLTTGFIGGETLSYESEWD